MHTLAVLDALISNLRTLSSVPVGSVLSLHHHDVLHEAYMGACSLSLKMQQPPVGGPTSPPPSPPPLLPPTASASGVRTLPVDMSALGETVLLVKRASEGTGCIWGSCGRDGAVVLVGIAAGSPAHNAGLQRFIGWQLARVNSKQVPQQVQKEYAERLTRAALFFVQKDAGAGVGT